MGIGIMTTYGVAEESVAYPTEMPPDFTGNPLEVTTPQITLVYKVCSKRAIALQMLCSNNFIGRFNGLLS